MSVSTCRPARLAAVLLVFAASALAAQDPPAAPPAVSRPADMDAVRKRLGLSPWYNHVRVTDRVKVAVLDFGFEGVDGARPYLPPDTVVVEHYDPEFVRRFGLGDPDFRKGFEPGNAHGRQMAQLVWAVTGNRPEGPKFYLLNANGPTLLRRAVRYAIEEQVDVILFSSVFEGGGNFDGGGPINRIVDDAVRAGIIWVNAAGNFGRMVYNGPVRVRAGGAVQLGTGTALHLRNRLDENTVTVTLTWNDYRDEEDAGTDKDLDLVVEGADGTVIAKGEAVQVAAGAEAGPGRSRNPRERVVLANLADDKGRPYRIKVQAKAGRFGAADRLRVLVTAAKPWADGDTAGRPQPAVELLDASGSGEIYPPADHPDVITVGDAGPTSAVGPTADGRRKPDVVIEDARARFTGGENTAGASNAAAYFAGVVAVLKAVRPEFQAEHVQRHIAILKQEAAAQVLAAAARGPANFQIDLSLELGPPPVPVLPPPEPRQAWRSLDGRIYVYSSRPPAAWGRLANHLDEKSARPLSSYAWQALRPLPPPPPAEPPPPAPARTVSQRSRPTTAGAPADRARARLAGPRWRTPDPAELKALTRRGAQQ
jgi:hypothetical protein